MLLSLFGGSSRWRASAHIHSPIITHGRGSATTKTIENRRAQTQACRHSEYVCMQRESVYSSRISPSNGQPLHAFAASVLANEWRFSLWARTMCYWKSNISNECGQLDWLSRMWQQSMLAARQKNMKSISDLVFADARHIFGILYWFVVFEARSRCLTFFLTLHRYQAWISGYVQKLWLKTSVHC